VGAGRVGGAPTYLVCRALDTDPRARTREALLAGDPQLMLARLRAAAAAAGAAKVYLCVGSGDPPLPADIEAALLAAGGGLDVTVVPIAPSLVLEDDSALLRVIEGRQAIPHPVVPASAPLTLWGEAAVVRDLETLLAPDPAAPSARTITAWVHGEPRVVAAPADASLGALLQQVAKTDPAAAGARAVRFGGVTGRFFAGAWLEPPPPAMAWCPEVLEIVPAGRCGMEAACDAVRELSAASCGACVACREGLRQIADIFADLAESRGGADSGEMLDELALALQTGSLCGLGSAAAEVLRSALEVFAEDFREHLEGRPCPEGGRDA
jgi:NADH-quinone oxidoreductase subunit F